MLYVGHLGNFGRGVCGSLMVHGVQEIHGKAFDIITSKNIEDFTKETWFSVKPGKPYHS